MSDDAGNRQRRAFEPPPWERGQFEELARRKAREQERQAVEDAAMREPAAAAREEEAVVPAEKPKAAGVEDVKVRAMLLELSIQEPSAVREVKHAGVVISGVLASGGAIMLGLGIVLLIQGGRKGLAGAGMIVAVGMFVIGFAVWLGYRAGRGQGS